MWSALPRRPKLTTPTTHGPEQRKQALKHFAAGAQQAADDVRRGAGLAHEGEKQQQAGGFTGGVLLGEATEAPAVRGAERGFWWEAAVETTREHIGERTEAEEQALT